MNLREMYFWNTENPMNKNQIMILIFIFLFYYHLDYSISIKKINEFSGSQQYTFDNSDYENRIYYSKQDFTIYF